MLGLGDGGGGGEGPGVNWSSGMDGFREIMRWYQLRGSVYYFGRFRC